jgi:hypothetical protein
MTTTIPVSTVQCIVSTAQCIVSTAQCTVSTAQCIVSTVCIVYAVLYLQGFAPLRILSAAILSVAVGLAQDPIVYLDMKRLARSNALLHRHIERWCCSLPQLPARCLPLQTLLPPLLALLLLVIAPIPPIIIFHCRVLPRWIRHRSITRLPSLHLQ